jgi:diadenosine tetraphosphate (Ap4A) HIT family hydrolase
MNSTLETFGYPNSLIGEGDHWAVLMRPKQVTVGALVLAAKSGALAFGALPRQAYAELGVMTAKCEAMLKAAFAPDKINYLMLMMVDPHVHFHVLPRYAAVREVDGRSFADTAWPGPPDVKHVLQTSPATMQAIRNRLMNAWPG